MNPPVAYDTAKQIKRTVFFTGSTAVTRGMGVCFDRDYGTAANKDEKRDFNVELPSITNNMAFAGVAAKSYAARSGGQMIEIFEPGSVCDILLGKDVVINTGVVTCQAAGADAGQFTKAGFKGRGTAIPLQTGSDGDTVLAKLLDGEESGLVEVPTIPTTGGAAVMGSYMLGGVTYFETATTIGTADANGALADGAFYGMKKGFVCEAAMTTNDITVTPATAGVQAATEDTAGTTGDILALASLAFDAAGEFAFLEWFGIWSEIASSGATLSAS